jgi:hypothetical protein
LDGRREEAEAEAGGGACGSPTGAILNNFSLASSSSSFWILVVLMLYCTWVLQYRYVLGTSDKEVFAFGTVELLRSQILYQVLQYVLGASDKEVFAFGTVELLRSQILYQVLQYVLGASDKEVFAFGIHSLFCTTSELVRNGPIGRTNEMSDVRS